MIPGTDVSAWQGQIVFGDAKWCAERVATAFGQDSRNGQHAAEIKARGIPRMAYFAAYPGDGARQAGMLIAYSGDAFALAFDGREFGALDQEAKDFFAFLDRNDPLGRPTYQYRELSQGRPVNGQKHDWVAFWSANPPPNLRSGDIWQNTGGGPGYGGDHDYAIGTDVEWGAITMAPTAPANLPDIELATVNLVRADYYHAVKLHPGAAILTPTGGPRSTAKGGEVLAWIGSDANYHLVSDGSTLALVLRSQADKADPAAPIHIASGN